MNVNNKESDSVNWRSLSAVIAFVLLVVGHAVGTTTFAVSLKARVDHAITRLDQLAVDVKEIARTQHLSISIQHRMTQLESDFRDHQKDPGIHTRAIADLKSQIQILDGRVRLLEQGKNNGNPN